MGERWDWWLEQVAAFNKVGYRPAEPFDGDGYDLAGEDEPATLSDPDDEAGPPLAHERDLDGEVPSVRSGDETEEAGIDESAPEHWTGPATL